MNLIFTRLTGDQITIAWGPGFYVVDATYCRIIGYPNGETEQVTNSLAAINTAVGAVTVGP